MSLEISLEKVNSAINYDILVRAPSGLHFTHGFYSPLDFSFFTLIGRR